jgi:thioredoxin reductase/NAD-dependent dihydropyrimidine dehydrogenase PreA subunit
MNEHDALRIVDARRNPLGRARAAKSVSRTSDVFRVRDVLLAVVVAVGALLGGLVVFPGASVRSPGPLPRVHAQLACAKCHDATGGPSNACVGCHGAHPSTRRGHRRMAQAGKLACTNCHAQHHDSQGVTFEENGAFVKWGDGLETRGEIKTQLPPKTTVPLLSLSSCAKCHDLKNAGDPAFRCVSYADSQTRFDTCFDEHQHLQSDRFVAWGAASEIAHDTPPVRASASQAARSLAWLAFPAFASALSLVILRSRRRRLVVATPEIVPPAPSARIRLPQINASTCVGCYACVDACPFDVLEIQKYVAVVVRPADCCGVILCEQACPNGSLQIAEGEPIEARPNVDAHLESLDAPRVFLAGDLSGLPLIKNAIAQGTRVIDRIADGFPAAARSSNPEKFDVVIVGSGPAGLSAALRAIDRGLSYVVLEQATMAASIQSFPRIKLVFDQPLQLPVVGDLWLREATKEELLVQWTRIVRQRHIDIRDHHRVVSFDRTSEKIVVHALHEGESQVFVASHVVLATGRTGTPRKLDAPIAPDALASVSYSLADARTFAGKEVVIVGLGDSAMEAAIALAGQPGCKVTISHRGADFGRGKSRNVSELKSLVAAGKIRLEFDSTVRRIDYRQLTLEVHGKPKILPFDALFVMIGGTPPSELLRAAGVTWVGRAHENQHE